MVPDHIQPCVVWSCSHTLFHVLSNLTAGTDEREYGYRTLRHFHFRCIGENETIGCEAEHRLYDNVREYGAQTDFSCYLLLYLCQHLPMLNTSTDVTRLRMLRTSSVHNRNLNISNLSFLFPLQKYFAIFYNYIRVWLSLLFFLQW